MKITAITAAATCWLVAAAGTAAAELSAKERLGRSIFFDDNLSVNQNQSCAACHAPESGWTGPDAAVNAGGSVYQGSIPGQFGDRKPPSSAYATQSPIFYQDKKGVFIGGNFWDGRATGEKLGNPAADQAQGPFLNPREQALPDSACIVYRVCNPVVPEDYPTAFEEVWGERACDVSWPADVEAVCTASSGELALTDADRDLADAAYDSIALSIAAYEASPEVNAFSSKFDLSFTGKVKLNPQEQRGFALFRGKGGCHRCHTSSGQGALFTDYTFDNLGLPQNPENPAGTAPGFVDHGLGGFLEMDYYPPGTQYSEAEKGKFKVPTLRNVGRRPAGGFVKAYGHNGYFKSLKGIVHFYNTRDVKPTCPGLYTEAEALAADCWPAPEVDLNINTEELGNLGLTPEEEDAIVAFMEALSDGYTPP